MPRQKPTPAIIVADLGGADKALARLAELKRVVDEEEARMNAAIDKIKAHAKEATAWAVAERAQIEASLASFAETKKEELFTKQRSHNLFFGKLGFRKSTEIKGKGKITLAKILEKVKGLITGEPDDPFAKAVRTKEELNRDEMKDWPEERLELVGARKVPKDTFFYELELEKLPQKAA